MNNNKFLESFVYKIDTILDLTQQTGVRDEVLQLLLQSLLLNIESVLVSDDKIINKIPNYDTNNREKIIELLETVTEEHSKVVVKAINITLTDFVNRIDTLSDDAKKELLEKISVS